ncbi:NADPH-dependent 2,4-dienoyl-CoA reductase/sulfur reductase-like enzyme/bacterioferritin-associated ferredoxin [Rhizobium sp. BK077]|uniref:NAD(P)/FAD-dependent oxidoreductase n=1 Tax=unclassified Rhizobium TaxID=2613769 RepID=UPI00160E15AE|nr:MULTISPECIES: NAD(P)/FAD-dependent oxidoreductase [unclassified Rhizobium]MBB3302188.1 NADPH-dependent 2,4-dienoyl-CoA reductase/sulfur reductase-like enzyme/bacterioferritin-associated ferredoxin [Rhizobium sp. BK112]MBB3371310.1 NADPH-dependent 2,4-dienoyl-CoA reductase/sulfur reductase-like enzyme/bacterioferritin-associated ferredoxin [Rhizobium sp. BK077]MBB4182202.1 NADPH-dependent 2,4-dienoyl-CoA reductase/sulfur reductase-like enzyme/bacterioferritin-associated ferredoxin [Rhizobium s
MNTPTNPAPHGQGRDRPAPDADVIVIGAGPAGMSAAVELASAGRHVIVLDLQPAPGGQIFRALEANLEARPGTDDLLAALGSTYNAGRTLIQQFRATPGIDYRPETTVWDLRADGTVGWLKDESAGYLRARHVVVANGAMERPAPFPGWTLPGVMTAGAVQTLIKAGRLQPEGRIVLAGTGPLIFLLADQLRRLGVKPALIARTDQLKDKFHALPHLRPAGIPALLKGLGWLSRLRLAGIPMRTGVSDLRARGQNRVETVSMSIAGGELELPCDLLVVHDGIVPSTDLAHCAGLALEWQQADASWRPKTSQDGQAQMAPGPSLTSEACCIHISGDARQIGGADAAIAHGRHAAKAILAKLNRASDKPVTGAAGRTAAAVKRTMAGRPFIDVAFAPGLAKQLPDDATIVCRCEEITAGSLRKSIRGGATDMNLIRGLLRCGMGPCQGRSCAVTVARLLAEATTQTPTSPAPFRARPPLRPLPLGALANLTGLDPELAKVVSLDDKPQTAGGGDDHA